MNTRYDPGSRSASETMGDKLHRREGNCPDHQRWPLNDRSVIKEVGVQRHPGGLPRSSTPDRPRKNNLLLSMSLLSLLKHIANVLFFHQDATDTTWAFLPLQKHSYYMIYFISVVNHHKRTESKWECHLLVITKHKRDWLLWWLDPGEGVPHPLLPKKLRRLSCTFHSSSWCWLLDYYFLNVTSHRYIFQLCLESTCGLERRLIGECFDRDTNKRT
jgi:hypothetical protein